MFRQQNQKRLLPVKFLLACLFLGAVSNAEGAWGAPDASFGNGGTVQETSSEFSAADVAVQPDGKILVAGCRLASNGKKRFMLRRYLSNGQLDTSFGSNGSAVIGAITNINIDYCGLQVRMATYSKIAVLGYAGASHAVWMVESNGQGLANFGAGGIKTLSNYPTATYLNSRLGALGGTPVVSFYDPSNDRVVIIRLTSTGAQNTDFGSNGESYVYLYTNHPVEYSFDMLTESETNRILVGGLSINGTQPKLKMFRKLSSGLTDLSFNYWYEPSAHPLSKVTGIYKFPSGKYVYGYYAADGATFGGEIIRLSASGDTEESIYCQACKLIGMQPNGKFVIEYPYTISRTDENFSSGGSFSIQQDLYAVQWRQYAFQPDNKMIVVGMKNDRMTIMRLLAD